MKQFLLAIMILFSAALTVDAAEPIKIGLSLGFTGKYAELADVQFKAFKLWERDVNKRGGILGRKVRIIVYDDKSDAQTAKVLYDQLINKDRVDMLFTPYSSDITEAILPLTEKNGYPIIASAASSDVLWQKGYKYLFGLYTPASRYSIGFLEMLVKHGIDNVAIAYSEDVFSNSVATGAKEWAEKFGLKVLMFSNFNINNADEFVNKARLSNAHVLMVCGHFKEAVDVRLSLKKAGWYPKAYYASVGPALQAFHERLGPDADYAFSSSQWEHHGKLPGSTAFYRSFRNAYGKSPSYHSAAAYASGEILEKAIIRAGTINRKKVRDVLSLMEAMTIMGRHGVDRKTGKQIKQFSRIIQNQKGRKEIVWPEDLSSAKPVFK